MESSIVIKVTYGETLRRFNARVVDEELDFDMNRLRERIRSLFNFSPDSDLDLTYIDEDGDVVTLVDEQDLHDVMRQSLNPLRITVRFNSEESGRSYSRSSGNSTPMRSPQVQPPLENLNSRVSEILKSIPESILETISRLPTEFASNTRSLPPGYVELVDSLSKMGLSYFKEVSVSKPKNGAPGSSSDAPVTTDQISSKSDGTTTKTSEPNVGSKNNEADLGSLTRISESLIIPASDLLEPNGAGPGDKFSLGFPSVNPAPNSRDENKEKFEKLGEYNDSGKSGVTFVQGSRIATNSPGDKMKDIKRSNDFNLGWKSVGDGSAITPGHLKPSYLDSELGGYTGKKLAADSGNSLGSHFVLNSSGEYPSNVKLLKYDPAVPYVPPHQYAPRVVPLKRGYNQDESVSWLFHQGVSCDGCGVHPITGPRYKSKVKEDYDLCFFCFAKIGNEADYIRMDGPMQHRTGGPPTPPQSMRHSAGPSKFNSHFIQDVNILDNTIMAPSIPFTKIWRMRNNGTIVWPRGSRLVWIGGDRLSKAVSTELEIPADGVPVNKEIDITVDFIAPEIPGRYISYWRMAAPSGQKFGQRIWVLIQVDDSLKGPLRENVHGFNLNLPPVNSGITATQVVNASVEPTAGDNVPEPDNSNRETELVEPVVAPSNKDQELNFSINDTLLVGGGVSNPAPFQPSFRVSYPNLNFSGVEMNATSGAQTSTIDVNSSLRDVGGMDEVENTLLKELEEMGFKQVDLNKEILRMNEYNLELSVDDLCEVVEWDPILKELQEMGFCDDEMNKKLLKKNNGSIKGVVMDLISGENA